MAIAVLEQEAGCFAGLNDLQDGLPDTHQVFQVPAQLLFGPADPGRAHDDAHTRWNFYALEGVFDDFTVLAGNSSRHATRPRVVRHQDDESAGETDKGRQRGTLVAAFFLFDLDDNVLAFLQHIADVDSLPGLRLIQEILLGDFLQRQKAVAFSAVINEGSVEAGLDPGNLTLIDVGLFLGAGCNLDVEIDEFLTIDHGHTQLFFLSCVDKHSLHKPLL